MNEYTAEDFESARFAGHENWGTAARTDDTRYPLWFVAKMGEPWFMEDREMAENGWRPVRESAPLTLDALREAWENAEQSGGCREGDVLMTRHSDDNYEVWVSVGAFDIGEKSRVLRRAPQPEPWVELAGVLHDEAPRGVVDVDHLAERLHAAGVRVTGGDTP